MHSRYSQPHSLCSPLVHRDANVLQIRLMTVERLPTEKERIDNEVRPASPFKNFTWLLLPNIEEFFARRDNEDSFTCIFINNSRICGVQRISNPSNCSLTNTAGSDWICYFKRIFRKVFLYIKGKFFVVCLLLLCFVFI